MLKVSSNIVRILLLILYMIIMLSFQFCLAIVFNKPKVMWTDVRIFYALNISIFLLITKFISGFIKLVKLAILQDEYKFNCSYRIYCTYFENLYLTTSSKVNEWYTIRKMISLCCY